MRLLAAVPDPNSEERIDSYELRTLGDKAARKYLDRGINLNDAIADVIRSSGMKLNNHHVQRVVEFANLRAFRELRQQGTGSAGRAVSFDGGPASATSVIGSVRGGTKEARMNPDHTIAAASPGVGLLHRADGMISDRMMHKAASAQSSAEEDVDAVDLYVKLGHATDESRKRTHLLEEKMAMAGREIVRYAASTLAAGATLGDIHRVLYDAAGPRRDFVKMAVELIERDVCPRFGLIGEVAEESLEKVSNLRVNPKHPLFVKMAEFTQLCDQLEDSRNATNILTNGRLRVGRLLRS